MKVFSTADLEASIRKAHADFTHVILDRTYSSLRPVFFRTGNLVDLPIHMWADWLGQDQQMRNWQKQGGVLICQGSQPQAAGPNDVMLFVEVPFTMASLKQCTSATVEYAVLPHVNWRTYEQALNVYFPPEEQAYALQKALWKFGSSDHPALDLLGLTCGYVCMDLELGDAVGLPHTQVQYMLRAFKPRTVYQIGKRLAPENAALREVYDKAEGIMRKEALTLQERKALKEMDRLGHLRLTKYRVFPNRLLNMKRHLKKREQAFRDLAEVRSLVESAPDHLQT